MPQIRANHLNRNEDVFESLTVASLGACEASTLLRSAARTSAEKRPGSGAAGNDRFRAARRSKN